MLCSGAGRSPAAAVPLSAAATASTPHEMSTGTRLARENRVRQKLAHAGARSRDLGLRTASSNAATAACSPESSRSVAGRAAAPSSRASACSSRGAPGSAP